MYTRRGIVVIFGILYIICLVYTAIMLPKVFITFEEHEVVDALLDGEITAETLPEGYYIDEERSTQRIFCLVFPDQSWGRWSWGGDSYHVIELGDGWLYYVKLFAFPVLPAMVLFAIVTLLIYKFWY